VRLQQPIFKYLWLILICCPSLTMADTTFAISNAPNSLHPILATDASSERINALIYQPIIELDENDRPISGLADIKQHDAQYYSLTLRSTKHRFSNNADISLLDIAASLNLARNHPRSPQAKTLNNIASIETTKQSILISLKKPDHRFAEKLHISVAPKEMLLKDEALAQHPVGSGAFEWVKTQGDGGVTLRHRRSDKEIRFVVNKDPTMRVLKLLKGEASILQNDLPHEMYRLLKEDPNIQVAQTPGTTFSYIGFNMADPILKQNEIRQAIAYAINRQVIVKHLFQSNAKLANTLLAPGHWAAHPDLPAYEHSPDKAKQLLATLGYSKDNPLELSYKTSTDPFRLRIAAVFEQQLREVGIHLTIQSYEWGSFFGDIKAGRFQLYSLSWVGIRSPDVFRYVYHSDSLPPSGANRGRYVSAEVDQLIEQAEELPLEKSLPLYRKIQEKIHRDLVYVPLWHEDQIVASRRGDLKPNKHGSYQYLEQEFGQH
jgi:peptide/nickel transport system substrate-binding protein